MSNSARVRLRAWSARILDVADLPEGRRRRIAAVLIAALFVTTLVGTLLVTDTSTPTPLPNDDPLGTPDQVILDD